MKKTLIPALCLLLCSLILSIIPTEAEAAIYSDTVRLHILAPSDSAEDQVLKLFIRDKLLQKYSALIAPMDSAANARRTVASRLTEIEEDCRAWLAETGADCTVKAELIYEWYETREYSSFTLPAGKYCSLKILLGSGEGQNWWCVMYPPLCLDCALGGTEALSDEEYNIISKSGYNVKFKLLELSASIFDTKKTGRLH